MTSAAPAARRIEDLATSKRSPARSSRSTARAAGSRTTRHEGCMRRPSPRRATAGPSPSTAIAAARPAAATRSRVKVAVAGVELEDRGYSSARAASTHEATQRLVLRRVRLREAGRRRARIVDGDADDRRLPDERGRRGDEARAIGAVAAGQRHLDGAVAYQARDRAVATDEGTERAPRRLHRGVEGRLEREAALDVDDLVRAPPGKGRPPRRARSCARACVSRAPPARARSARPRSAELAEQARARRSPAWPRAARVERHVALPRTAAAAAGDDGGTAAPPARRRRATRTSSARTKLRLASTTRTTSAIAGRAAGEEHHRARRDRARPPRRQTPARIERQLEIRLGRRHAR